MHCAKYLRKPDPVAPPPPEVESPDEQTHHAEALRHAEQVVDAVLQRANPVDDGWDEGRARQVSQ
jgi:hypothetical protein